MHVLMIQLTYEDFSYNEGAGGVPLGLLLHFARSVRASGGPLGLILLFAHSLRAIWVSMGVCIISLRFNASPYNQWPFDTLLHVVL